MERKTIITIKKALVIIVGFSLSVMGGYAIGEATGKIIEQIEVNELLRESEKTEE